MIIAEDVLVIVNKFCSVEKLLITPDDFSLTIKEFVKSKSSWISEDLIEYLKDIDGMPVADTLVYEYCTSNGKEKVLWLELEFLIVTSSLISEKREILIIEKQDYNKPLRDFVESKSQIHPEIFEWFLTNNNGERVDEVLVAEHISSKNNEVYVKTIVFVTIIDSMSNSIKTFQVEETDYEMLIPEFVQERSSCKVTTLKNKAQLYSSNGININYSVYEFLKTGFRKIYVIDSAMDYTFLSNNLLRPANVFLLNTLSRTLEYTHVTISDRKLSLKEFVKKRFIEGINNTNWLLVDVSLQDISNKKVKKHLLKSKKRNNLVILIDREIIKKEFFILINTFDNSIETLLISEETYSYTLNSLIMEKYKNVTKKAKWTLLNCKMEDIRETKVGDCYHTTKVIWLCPTNLQVIIKSIFGKQEKLKVNSPYELLNCTICEFILLHSKHIPKDIPWTVVLPINREGVLDVPLKELLWRDKNKIWFTLISNPLRGAGPLRSFEIHIKDIKNIVVNKWSNARFVVLPFYLPERKTKNFERSTLYCKEGRIKVILENTHTKFDPSEFELDIFEDIVGYYDFKFKPTQIGENKIIAKVFLISNISHPVGFANFDFVTYPNKDSMKADISESLLKFIIVDISSFSINVKVVKLVDRKLTIFIKYVQKFFFSF
ncbi:MAG: hypothetical protein ACTSYD_13530 [Candidatus Heimdallarchaeaceae archaeon]